LNKVLTNFENVKDPSPIAEFIEALVYKSKNFNQMKDSLLVELEYIFNDDTKKVVGNLMNLMEDINNIPYFKEKIKKEIRVLEGETEENINSPKKESPSRLNKNGSRSRSRSRSRIGSKSKSPSQRIPDNRNYERYPGGYNRYPRNRRDNFDYRDRRDNYNNRFNNNNRRKKRANEKKKVFWLFWKWNMSKRR